jgi:hypothetical protein
MTVLSALKEEHERRMEQEIVAILTEAAYVPEEEARNPRGLLPMALTRGSLWSLLLESEHLGSYLDPESEDDMRMFDRCRQRLRRRGEIAYTPAGWHVPGALQERSRILLLRRCEREWKEALQKLAREAGEAIMSASEETWESTARVFRARYYALKEMGSDAFAQRGMPGDFEVLVRSVGAS